MKRKIFAVALAAAMTISSATVASADVEKDLIGHYTFEDNLKNEVSGKEATTVAKPATDGKVGDEAAVDLTYKEGFAGGKALDLSSCLAGAVKLDIVPKSSSFTISFLVKGDSFAQGNKPVVWIGKQDQSTEAWHSIKTGSWEDGNKNGPMIWNKSGGSYIDLPAAADSTITSLEEGKWNLCTFAFDNGKAQIYVNGEKTYNGDVPTDVITADTWILLGGTAWQGDYAPALQLDELYVYDRALTDADVTELAGKFDTENQTTPEPTEATTRDLSFMIDDGKDVTKKATTTEAKDSNVGLYVGIGVAAVVVIAGVAVAVVAKGKKKAE